MNARFLPSGMLALSLAMFSLFACSASRETTASGGAQALPESPQALNLGLPLGGSASGFWPQNAASFGALFARVGYLGQTPLPYGDGTWISHAALATLARNGQSLAPELSFKGLAGDKRASELGDGIAAAYHGGTGALLTLKTDGVLRYHDESGRSFHVQAIAPDKLLPGGYALALSGRFAALQSFDGAIAVYALPDMRLLWQSQAARGSLRLTEESALYLSAEGSLLIRALDTGSLLTELRLGLSPGHIAPVFDGTLIYIAGADGSVLALDARSLSLQWRVNADYAVEQLICDRGMVYAFGPREAIAIASDQGRILARVALPVRALLLPQLFGGSMVYTGVDGYLYANDLSLSSSPPASSAEEERLAQAIRFRLDKYLVDHSIAELAGPFLSYVDLAPHDGVLPFTVFAYPAPEQSGEMVLELFEADGKTQPNDGIVSVFDEGGEEIKANVDEFGSHPSFNHWFDAGKRYYLAVGRRVPGMPPLFLRVRKL